MRALTRDTGKAALLALLYFLAGQLGLVLVAPLSHATIIWPPAGIALGFVLMHGRHLWPGVLVGSLVLNAYVGGVYSPEQGLLIAKAVVALGIAIGTTLQVVAGQALISHFIGLPLRLKDVKQVLSLFALAGPLSCLVAASSGVGSQWLGGQLPAADIASEWLTWWVGDVAGVLVFLPLVMMAPSPNRVAWRGEVMDGLPMAATLLLAIPLCLTLYAWKIASQGAVEQSRIEFAALASENEKALLHRLDSYQAALLGGAGLFLSSTVVTRSEWHSYVDTLQLKRNFPGMSGIGWIEAVPEDGVAEFLERTRADGAPGFSIRHEAIAPFYVITYVEPTTDNEPAIGLNIAFEKNRRQAASLARDTAKAAITRRITLVQDQQQAAGFLLLYPIYRAALPLGNPEDRRAALRGWIYAPFVARDFLNDLTESQSHEMRLSIYDGGEERADKLIYSDGPEDQVTSKFVIRKQLQVMQQPWLLKWESTPAFDREKRTNGPLFILIAGLLFTGLFGLFLLVFTARRPESVEWLGGEGKYTLPLLVFLTLALGSYLSFQTLQRKEFDYVLGRIRGESHKIDLLLNSHINDRLLALKRMALRWNAAGGTPRPLWQIDARNYTTQLGGLRALEWVDPSLHVRWIEPLSGNERALGLDVTSDERRRQQLKDTALGGTPTVTPPLELVQGYTAFIAYQPLDVGGRSDGFLVGIFDVTEFFASAIVPESADQYAVTVSYAGREYFSNDVAAATQDRRWATERKFRIYDQEWTLRVAPTRRFVANQHTPLPIAVLVAGLLIALLSAVALRYILVSRLKSTRLLEDLAARQRQRQALKASEEQMRLLVENTPAAVAMFDRELKYLLTSRRWIEDYRLEGRQIIGKSHYELFPEILGMASWVDIHRRALSGEIFGKHEDSWVREDGRTDWIEWAIHPWIDNDGSVGGIVMFTEVITARKEAEQAIRTSEQTFRTAMEYAPIGKALVSAEGRWLNVNAPLCRLLRMSEAELLSGKLLAFTADDPQEERTARRRLLAGEIQTCELEKYYHCTDGRLIPTLVSMSLARQPAGTPDYFIVQVQDISERKEVERIKSEFVSVVSHELRTPLTSIRGSLGLIMGAFMPDLPQKVRGLVGIAHNNCERLILLINDILDIDKIASGNMRFDIREESLSQITQQAIQANEAYARKFNVSIELQPVDFRLRVRVDAGRYVQVLSNLLSNAAKFSPPGSTVDVCVTSDADHARVAVTDHGEGIPEEFQSRLFERFAQADSSASRPKGGTGLGLHITKQLIEHMNGSIGFSTRLGQGTTFWVEFPTRNASRPEPATAQS